MRISISLTLLLLLTITSFAQKRPFVRVFDESGRKINKGILVEVADSSITILQNNSPVEIPISQIATLKLRRSMGHTMLMTSVITGALLGVLGTATADPGSGILSYTAGEGFAVGLLIGAVGGILPGAIIGGTRYRPVFRVNQSLQNWQKMKDVLRDFAHLEAR